jgi:hypothetical protein
MYTDINDLVSAAENQRWAFMTKSKALNFLLRTPFEVDKRVG